jgi:hypothetical protein
LFSKKFGCCYTILQHEGEVAYEIYTGKKAGAWEVVRVGIVRFAVVGRSMEKVGQCVMLSGGFSEGRR